MLFRLSMVLALLGMVPANLTHAAAPENGFRPPAVPLVTCDPYFSVWSFADRLTDDTARHWTGAKQSLTSMVRVDGKAYRVMGDLPDTVPALNQVSVRVWPTRTVYDFEGAGVHLTLTFMTPLLPGDLDVLSRPATYLTWQVRSVDGKQHAVSVYFDASSELAVDTPEQTVAWRREQVPGLKVMRVGRDRHQILQRRGDDLRIDWGYAYVAAPEAFAPDETVTDHHTARQSFVSAASLPPDDTRQPRPVSDGLPVMAVSMDLGQVAAEPVERHLILAYDDVWSIEYLDQRLRAYWRRNGARAADLLQWAARDYASLGKRCRTFDEELTADLKRQGGPEYERLASLAYRQSLAANKLVAGPNGEPFLFPKENFSNGCIATVDVIYPGAPLLLLLNPRLLEAQLVPVLEYARSGRWHFPFAPHDLGTYPLADGQVYGGREHSEEDQMPVEESGNMLILAAALAKIEGHARFGQKYWPLLAQWADYLKKEGLDPANQLCTDDFAGHLAHNANLSLKAIEALASYAMLCRMTGHTGEAATYSKSAMAFALQWVKMARDDNHYRLAFDKPGTWSQKYNLVWDTLLGYKLFPDTVAEAEVKFYESKLGRFGLPLDNRKGYTKLDWELWTATLAVSHADFQALLSPIYNWLSESPSRVPLTDWYWTSDGKQAGFQARSVVGGVYIKMLSAPEVWSKWASQSTK
jgi:Domain of unknown function (DUF4965)/Domain of unknown function (DUF5127)/Domain of unknown function (DUF1793)/Domain of unknown function (DUF4964)